MHQQPGVQLSLRQQSQDNRQQQHRTAQQRLQQATQQQMRMPMPMQVLMQALAQSAWTCCLSRANTGLQHSNVAIFLATSASGSGCGTSQSARSATESELHVIPAAAQ